MTSVADVDAAPERSAEMSDPGVTLTLTERVRVATTQRVVLDGLTTWTVVSESFLVEPLERYLEFGRQTGFAPNTITAYARGLAQWWTYLETSSKSWDAVRIHDFGNFLAAVRSAVGVGEVRKMNAPMKSRAISSTLPSRTKPRHFGCDGQHCRRPGP
jgi:hypothetical protein